MKTQKHVRTTKTAINFRLNRRALLLLSLLKEKLHTSKTDVVEKALQHYASQKLNAKQSTLMQYAGILSEQESDRLLVTIKNDRHNKVMRVKL
ncbi:MAG TPA: hypothetical protein VI844_01650 [Coxiellaceae bacterium]|nr:hypothetical protein [Coxiellaceae bacterium]